MLKKKGHKDNKFPVTSSKIDHGQRPITAPVPFRFIISFFKFLSFISVFNFFLPKFFGASLRIATKLADINSHLF